MVHRKDAKRPKDGEPYVGQSSLGLKEDKPAQPPSPHLTLTLPPLPPSPPAEKETMTAVFIERAGGPRALLPRKVDCLQPLKDDEVLIRVAAIGVNGLDLDQRRMGIEGLDGTAGFFPGLECSGHIEAVGKKVDRQRAGQNVGHRVCAFLDGGGYAEKVVVPPWRVLPVPSNISLLEAACLPEAAYATWRALYRATLLGGLYIEPI